MESLEVRAKTVEEAIQRALQQIGRNREEVEVVVVREGRSGILGLGAEEAIVRVTPLMSEPVPSVSGPAVTAHQVLEQLLGLLGISASIETQPSPVITEDTENESSPIALDIEGDNFYIC